VTRPSAHSISATPSAPEIQKTPPESAPTDAAGKCSTNETVQVHLRLPIPVERALRAMAHRRGQTLSGAVRYLVLTELKGSRDGKRQGTP
jgi:hypothetical protein